VRQRQFKMPAKKVANGEEAEAEQPKQSQPETERYLLRIDTQAKRSFKTLEIAQTAALEIKSRFPSLHVSIYDVVIGVRTIVNLPN
jgi:hypothetical protein